MVDVRAIVFGLALAATGCRQVFGLDDPLAGDPGDGGTGSCTTQTLTTSGMFAPSDDCRTFTVEALGGGGAGGARNSGTAAAGGMGGRAIARFVDVPAGSMFVVTIGAGGSCGSSMAATGGFAGGGGGTSGGPGGTGQGAASPPGGTGGDAPTGAGAGGKGGNGGYGGGGGGAGGDNARGNGGGGATTFQEAGTLAFLVVAGGGGGAGAADQNNSIAGAGGAACAGYGGLPGMPGTPASSSAGGGGGGGACTCQGGTCMSDPDSMGANGGLAGTSSSGCAAAQSGQPGRVIIRY